MEKHKEELTRRPLYVYDLPKDVLSSLKPKEATTSEDIETGAEDATRGASPGNAEDERATTTSNGSKSCSLCNMIFISVDDQRSHMRSDLHNYNLKQKLRGLRAVTEVEFETLVEDLDESLSGSDSSDSEEDDNPGKRKDTLLSALLEKQAKLSGENEANNIQPSSESKPKQRGKQPLVWFSSSSLPKNTFLGIYRAIFTTTELESETSIIATINRKQIPASPAPKIHPTAPGPQTYSGPHIFMCMIGGGHFAAMAVALAPRQTKHSTPGPLNRDAVVLAHKTFHRYTTRRKQGGAQSANDSAKGAAHSAGAGLRRYNEQALTDEVRLLLWEWKALIDTSELLFIRATGTTNRRTLFGPYDGQALHLNDSRLRSFPFNTRRATQNELMRAFIELTRVKVREIDEAAEAAKAAELEAAKQANAAKPIKQSLPATSQISEEDETALLHTNQIQALIRRSKLPALLSYLTTNNLSPDFKFYPTKSQQNHHASTPLHLAASLNSPTLVQGLLVKAKANPTLLNGDKKHAFDLAGDRSTRDAFRVARHVLGEESCDWDAANTPSALSSAQASERDAREKTEANQKEEERRKAEVERMKSEGPKLREGPLGKAAERGRAAVLGQVQHKTGNEKREEQAKGMTPEMRAGLERERRARAAEERMKRFAQGSGS